MVFQSCNARRVAVCAAVCGFALSASAQRPNPFASNNGTVPPRSQYSGPLFQLSYDYPQQAALPNTPWRAAINNGVITVDNAKAYVDALKASVSADMRILIQDYANWNAAERGWYNEPWLSAQREPIHGTYVGSSDFPKALFAGSGLAKDFSTYVLTYYSSRAATTQYAVWGKTALNPAIKKISTQVQEGGVIVKLALSTANADTWPVMAGTQQWPLYITTNATTGNHASPQVDMASVMQFDMIVKDTQSAPQTGWVFSTLVYDKDAPGVDVWDKMVPLGVMWGNDPQSNSALPNPPPLKENWINPAAPGYAKMTLGWGGRLSGPNDGALNDAIYGTGKNRKVAANLPSSSCMSCHGPSEWPFKSFLLPTTTMPPQNPQGDYLVMWPPGSPQWMRWFQSRNGSTPQDVGTVAFDYDMVFAFKSLPAWQKAMSAADASIASTQALTKHMNKSGAPGVVRANAARAIHEYQYHGKPVKSGTP
jgi:hypothetical protein